MGESKKLSVVSSSFSFLELFAGVLCQNVTDGGPLDVSVVYVQKQKKYDCFLTHEKRVMTGQDDASLFHFIQPQENTRDFESGPPPKLSPIARAKNRVQHFLLPLCLLTAKAIDLTSVTRDLYLRV